MMMNKEEIEKRIKEIDVAIHTQAQYVQQINNQILMLHGAKEEWGVVLKKIEAEEKLAADEAAKASEAEKEASNG